MRLLGRVVPAPLEGAMREPDTEGEHGRLHREQHPPALHPPVDAVLHELKRDQEQLTGERGPERGGQGAQLEDARGAVAQQGQHDEHPQVLHAQADGEAHVAKGQCLDPANEALGEGHAHDGAEDQGEKPQPHGELETADANAQRFEKTFEELTGKRA
ncbi:hypothetical protein ACN28S_37120 [Cystobacter fuscus]